MLHEELRSVDVEGLVANAEKRPGGNHVTLTQVNLPGFAERTSPNVRLTVPDRLKRLESDPWAEIGKLRQSISARVRRAAGI